jgi:glycosyltransferase involved in cell wall biosynthesis
MIVRVGSKESNSIGFMDQIGIEMTEESPHPQKVMNITLIVCTFNRCQELAKALSSAAAQTLTDSIEWEVLVVDNNSSDQTHEIVEGFRREYPGRFRYIFEPRQGKSFALNTGIREARGDILAFTDDDVTVDPGWLQNITSALHDGKWAGAGGRTFPDKTFKPPRWMELGGRYSLGPLAVFDLGTQALELTEPPFGNNMAFRREIFEKHDHFRTDLGPQPGSQIRSEDTEFGSRLLAAGERLRYEPSAIVYHLVPKARVRKDYFLDWWFAKARADVREFGVPTDTKWFVAGIPLRTFRRVIVWALRWMVTVEPSRRFSSKIKVWGNVGEILECRRQFLNAKLNSEEVSPIQIVRK